MKLLFLIFNLFISDLNFAATNPLDFEGCPDNSHCSKETGQVRLKWLEQLKNFNQNKMSEKQLNLNLSQIGIPFTAWAKDSETLKNKSYIFWDSPCKQHKKPNPKFYIAEIFVNNVDEKNLAKNPDIVFSKIYLEEKGNIKTVVVPRGDSPLLITNNAFYFIKEDEGFFYGLKVSPNGKMIISKTLHINNFPKEVECPKNLIENFYKNAPTSNFFSGHFCKEIYNEDKKSYTTILSGWSCN